MAPRRSARRLLALAAAVAVVAALSGCTPLSLFASWGGSAGPSKSASQTPDAALTATPSPSPRRTPSTKPTPGCVDRVISTAGTYRVGDCENLTVSGSGITVTAAHLGTLTVMGDSLQVYAAGIGALDLNGDLNTIQTNDDIFTLHLDGSRNMITCHGSMNSAVVTGDDNTVLVDGGIDGDVQNNGQRNAIGGQP
ncbi:MAG: hypothetical protein ABIP33_06840 [Pseudolysinimonas sp.]